MPRSAYTLTDEALFGLPACSEDESRHLLAALEELALSPGAKPHFVHRTLTPYPVLIRRVGSFAILYVKREDQPLHVIDVRRL